MNNVFGYHEAENPVRETTGKRIFPHQQRQLDITHVDGPDGYAPQESASSGLRTTRFKCGFERRQASAMKPHEDRFKAEAAKEVAKDTYLEQRRERLGEIGKYNGFNVISGEYDPAKVRSRQSAPRTLSDRPSAELLKSGEITIRNSHYRFFTPMPSGDEHDHRQKLLQAQGLVKPQMTSILGVGRADTFSYGVEDQFSKSTYGDRRKPVEGLHELNQPGRFTPRKTQERQTGGKNLFGGTWR